MYAAIFLAGEATPRMDIPTILDLKNAGYSRVWFPPGAKAVNMLVAILLVMAKGERGPCELFLRLVGPDGVQRGSVVGIVVACGEGPLTAMQSITWVCDSPPGAYTLQLAERSGRIVFEYPVEIEVTRAGPSDLN